VQEAQKDGYAMLPPVLLERLLCILRYESDLQVVMQ
jgi:hypothetical protein